MTQKPLRIHEVDENEQGQLVYGLEGENGYIVVTGEGRDRLTAVVLEKGTMTEAEAAAAIEVVRPRHVIEWNKR